MNNLHFNDFMWKKLLFLFLGTFVLCGATQAQTNTLDANDNIQLIKGTAYTIPEQSPSVYFLPNFFTKNTDGTYTFNGYTGFYSINYYKKSTLTYMQIWPKYGEATTILDGTSQLQSDGTGSIWAAGNSNFQIPPYEDYANWSSYENGNYRECLGVAAMSQNTDKVYQMTLTFGKELAATNPSFKFYFQRCNAYKLSTDGAWLTNNEFRGLATNTDATITQYQLAISTSSTCDFMEITTGNLNNSESGDAHYAYGNGNLQLKQIIGGDTGFGDASVSNRVLPTYTGTRFADGYQFKFTIDLSNGLKSGATDYNYLNIEPTYVYATDNTVELGTSQITLRDALRFQLGISYANQFPSANSLLPGLKTDANNENSLKIVGTLTDADVAYLEQISYSINHLDLSEAVFPENKIPDSFAYRSINGGTLVNNTTLKSVTLPLALSEVGEEAFAHCTAMTSVTFNGGTTVAIDGNSFEENTAMSSLIFSAGIYTIETQAFQKCKLLTDIQFNDNTRITSLGEEAFMECRSLSNSDCDRLMRDITKIEQRTFAYCNGSDGATLPGITKIDIPSSIAYIGDCAFAEDNLTDVVVNSASVPETSTKNGLTDTKGNSINIFDKVYANTCLVEFANDAATGDNYKSYRSEPSFLYLLTKTMSEDASKYDCVSQQHADVNLTRTFKKNWNTIALPFEMTTDQIKSTFGNNTEVAYYGNEFINSGNSSDKDDVLQFFTLGYSGNGKTAQTVMTTQPYIIMLVDEPGSTETIALPTDGYYKAEDVNIANVNTPYGDSKYTFTGEYQKKIDNIASDGNVLYIKDSKFYVRTKDNTYSTSMKPFRAYFKITSYTPAKSALSINVNESTDVTAIDGVQVNTEAKIYKVYNLNGQLVKEDSDLNGLHAGLYIINGKKCIVK